MPNSRGSPDLSVQASRALDLFLALQASHLAVGSQRGLHGQCNGFGLALNDSRK